MVWACDEKREALRVEMEVEGRRKAKEKMVGQSEGWYQREGTVQGGSV